MTSETFLTILTYDITGISVEPREVEAGTKIAIAVKHRADNYIDIPPLIFFIAV
ncbi:hypothetical protein [Nostoc sp. FACHB-888]|uniref:hypothetical protein n=1 Tax=Nostoc sp. FACHB-888 TaxID=2692842 RepID=UPI001682C624|nr:hypothetical protein [Nostoc sp. FACHB-888]MBD2244435.1 hypothetical protein [Nostoc sp. FACHB-888]